MWERLLGGAEITRFWTGNVAVMRRGPLLATVHDTCLPLLLLLLLLLVLLYVLHSHSFSVVSPSRVGLHLIMETTGMASPQEQEQGESGVPETTRVAGAGMPRSSAMAWFVGSDAQKQNDTAWQTVPPLDDTRCWASRSFRRACTSFEGMKGNARRHRGNILADGPTRSFGSKPARLSVFATVRTKQPLLLGHGRSACCYAQRSQPTRFLRTAAHFRSHRQARRCQVLQFVTLSNVPRLYFE